MQPGASTDITRVVLSVLVIGALLLGSLWTLLPFLSGLMWATTIVVATWPALLRLQGLTGGRRGLAAAIMTVLVLLAFIAPLGIAVNTLFQAAGHSPAVMSDFLQRGLGPPPAWLAKIPWFGDSLAADWQAAAAGGPDALKALVQPYAGAAAAAAIAATGGVGRTAILVLLTVVLVGILYARGETAAGGVLACARRLGGEPGEQAVRLAGQAIRGVALGVVVTALVQALLAGIGLWVCGIPHAGVLTAIAFILGIAQIGPLPVMALAAIWLYWTGSHGLGDRPDDLECPPGDARQRVATGLDSARRGTPAAAGRLRRHRRLDRLWRGRSLHRPRRARCHLHPCEGVGRSGPVPDRAEMTPPPTPASARPT